MCEYGLPSGISYHIDSQAAAHPGTDSAASNQFQGLVKRVKLLLAAAKGINNTQLSVALQMSRTTVRLWRQRWEGAADRLMVAEAKGVNDKQLTQLIISVLQDSERSGTPATFSTEQVVQIVALACEHPSKSGRPVSHWTPEELADEAVKRGIVVTWASKGSPVSLHR